jgi:hypothetical protein
MDVDDEAVRPKLESFFYYSRDNYFKGVFVRMKALSEIHLELKVYLR